MKEIKFRVHTLHQQMQFVMSWLEMGPHGKVLLACRAAVKELGDVDIQLPQIRRLPAEHACASCLSLMSAQK
jgi:hypothetical protein